jgi:two-component system response regulator HupR/HoxA
LKRVSSPSLKSQTRVRAGRPDPRAGQPAQCGLRHDRRRSPFDLSVLVTGESGTGKEMLARAIHYAAGAPSKAFRHRELRRAARHLARSRTLRLQAWRLHRRLRGPHRPLSSRPMVARCSSTKSAKPAPAFQVKLLRVLQEGEFRPLGSPRPVTVDVRVIAATNRDLEADVRDRALPRGSLLPPGDRPLHVPPLRERPMDIPLLASACWKPAAPCWAKSEGFFSRGARLPRRLPLAGQCA